MSFMTLVVFSWIFIVSVFSINSIINSFNSINNYDYDAFYTIKQSQKYNQNQNNDCLTIFAYTAVIAGIIIPHLNQID